MRYLLEGVLSEVDITLVPLRLRLWDSPVPENAMRDTGLLKLRLIFFTEDSAIVRKDAGIPTSSITDGPSFFFGFIVLAREPRPSLLVLDERIKSVPSHLIWI